MPQTYPSEQPHRRSSSASMLDNMGLTSLDVDDSIVLSDLLRTGEASRLRRRGAMRIDHNHPHSATSGGHVLRPPRLSSPNIVLVERTSWDSDSDLESPSFTSHWNIDSPNRFSRRHHPSSRRFGPHDSSGIGSSSQGEYILVCGSEVTNSESNHVEPFIPSILPLYPPPSASASITKKAVKKSTGCGTIVHMHAAPRSRFRMWTARTPASETVVPLDACYFDAKEANRFKRSQCGCVNEGVGCAVWYVFQSGRKGEAFNHLFQVAIFWVQDILPVNQPQKVFVVLVYRTSNLRPQLLPPTMSRHLQNHSTVNLIVASIRSSPTQ